MKFYQMEDLKKHTEFQVEVYQKLIAMLEATKPVVEQFDGKVINVRFTKALDAVLEPMNASSRWEKERNNLGINVWDRHYQNSHGTTNYAEYDSAWVTLTEAINDKRLMAAETLELIDKSIHEIRNDVKELQDGLANLDKTKQVYDGIKEAMNTFNKSLPYLFKDTFRLNVN